MKNLVCVFHIFVMAVRERHLTASVAIQRIMEEAIKNDNAVIDLQISDEEEHDSDKEDEELQLNSMKEVSDESEEEMTLLRIKDQIHKYKSPDGELWTTAIPQRTPKVPARNLIRQRPGFNTSASAGVHDDESSFLRIFDKTMIYTLVFETNRESSCRRFED